jgi:nitrite reductase (cytochrome c-552)
MKNSLGYLLIALISGVACFLIAQLAFNIQDRKQEAQTPFVRLQDVTELTTDPEPWGVNWPHQYDGYLKTAGDKFHGGSSALPDSKLEQQPWLKRLYAGYAFSLDYREARGHAYMLYDQGVTERVTERQQSGACLHCHASIVPTYRRVGLEAMGKAVSAQALESDFNWPAVMKGFETVSTKKYEEVFAELMKTPDGTAGENDPVFPHPPKGGFKDEDKELPENHFSIGEAHPVSCVDCHDPKTMAIRVTRPGFVNGIAALAESHEPTPHLPSIEKWRRGDRSKKYDPNLDASRQEMRTYVCAQCHVEYYCANKMTLTFPWENGLKAEQLEKTWEDTRFPDGSEFFDYVHTETGAKIYKVQHPEFELWSQGIHAQSGVSCADCHMPFERQGAMKLSSHDVASPMKNINHACQTCHKVNEDDLRYRVETIQNRTIDLMEKAATAMTDMLDTIVAAKEAGVGGDQLEELLKLQRKSMWRLDYISSENSRGFHAAQEAARILGESIDYSRQAQMLAFKLMAEAGSDTESDD